MSRRNGLAALTALAGVGALLMPGLGVGGTIATYAGGGTAVVKQSGMEPLLDDGGAVCMTQQIASLPNGLGGGCISFPSDGRPAAIRVTDAALVPPEAVAFQVCVDMNQDGHCFMRTPERGTPFQPLGPCDDRVGFSHADDGSFFNPLGFYLEPQPFGPSILKPLPTSLPPPGACPTHGDLPVARPAWPGYIVFLCEGAHVTDEPHVHTPTTGTIRLEMQAATGAGTFCQTIRDQFKEYYLAP